jgi:hypothetical protein
MPNKNIARYKLYLWEIHQKQVGHIKYSFSDSNRRDRRFPGLTDRCHELRRLDRSFRGFKDI